MAANSCVIVCTSVHHGNSRKVADAMALALGGRVLEPGDEAYEAAQDGALLGLGSGVFFGSHHKSLLAFARSLPQKTRGSAFLFSTSGTGYRIPQLVGIDYHRKLRHILECKGYTIAGEFSCKGFDTYGPWGTFGGAARGHPDPTDLDKARSFALSLAGTR
jgi:flavodoxin